MEINKQRLIEEILNCQELYAKIEKYNNVETKKTTIWRFYIAFRHSTN